MIAKSRNSHPALARMVESVAVFASGASTGLSLAHVLEKRPKKELSAPLYLAVQRNLYRNWGKAGAILEPTAFSSAIALAVLARRDRSRAALALGAAAIIAATTGIWKVFIDPINRRTGTWTNPEAMPGDWTRDRDRWERLHTLRAALSALATSALIMAATAPSRS
jgi:anthrone oxygenase-like protein